MTEKRTLPSAYVKHRLPGRIRLKIPQMKGDFAYFERIAEAFTGCKGLSQLHLNPPSASLLICHDEDSDFISIAEFAETNGLFALAAEPFEPVQPLFRSTLNAAAAAGLNQADVALRQFSQGRLDGRSLLFLSLLGLAAHQTAQGRIMAPAASLLWYALSLLKEENGAKPDSDDLAD